MSPLSRTRRLAAPSLLVAAAVALSACSESSSEPEAQTVEGSLQLGWIANVENMGPYVADRDGNFTDHGVDVTITPGGPSVTVEPLVQSGRALVGLSSTDVIARANAEGADLVIVGATLQVNPTSIMSLAESPVETLGDLVGKRLCIQTSGVSVMDGVLEQNGIDPADVEYVTAEFDPSPLVTGDCDAFVSLLNNQPVTLQLQGVETESFTLNEYGYEAWGNVVFTTRAALEDDATRQAVRGIVAGLQDGWATALADTDGAAEYMVEGPGASQNLDLEQQELAAAAFVELIATPDTDEAGLLAMTDEGIAANIATLEEQGIEGDLDALFDTSILDEIAQS
ncbi:ABC transporter substrate-binding protein [Demequina sp. NBRC 110057]|uniref:ABC transporter substrate-binding protein n=1 Tax=Demequina sp. NBRC 110057 TaxID=1570346 RepID=UPI0009FFE9C2|nr:ABC transporter substrate-binding protein [Demequina sp. NBRC 110057]